MGQGTGMAKRKAPIPVYFTSLELENVRCFGDYQRLDLTDGRRQPARWTVILGDNGVGKTTLLECLAWMRLVPVDREAPPAEVASPEKQEGLDEQLPLAKGRLGPALLNEENRLFERLFRVASQGELALSAKLSYGRSLSSAADTVDGSRQGKEIKTSSRASFDRKGRLLKLDHKELSIEHELSGEFHQPLIVAYGANRQRGYQNVARADLDDPASTHRLSEQTELYDIEEMLSDLDYASKSRPSGREHAELDRLREMLAKILPGDEFKPSDIEIYPPDVLDSGEPSGVCLNSFSGRIPLSALSLGYQTTMAWAADLAWRMLRRYPRSPHPLAEPAVALIDEIDLHLHPLWQLRIIDDLSEIFPRTQFVATSHSPLIVQVAETANFVLLRRQATEVEIVNNPEIVRSWRVDQILTSRLFDVPRARSKQVEALFARRAELLDKPQRSAGEETELERLRLQISQLPTAQDPEDQKAIDYIRKAAALLKKNRFFEK